MYSFIVFLFLICYVSAQNVEGKFYVNAGCANFLSSYPFNIRNKSDVRSWHEAETSSDIRRILF